MDGLLTLVVPEVLDEGSLAALEARLGELSSLPAGPLCLRGGPRHFCRGMSFAALAVGAVDAGPALRRFARVVGKLRSAARPTLAVVEGEALGGGVGLLAACDRVIATPDASVGLPEAVLGVLPGVILPVLAERMSAQKLRLLALDGLARDARWAERAGLFDDVVPHDQLQQAVRRAARSLSRVSAERVVGLRTWSEEARRLPIDQALLRGADLTSDLLHDEAVRGSLRRFVEEGVAPWEASA